MIFLLSYGLLDATTAVEFRMILRHELSANLLPHCSDIRNEIGYPVTRQKEDHYLSCTP
jgi:hypothetical protein